MFLQLDFEKVSIVLQQVSQRCSVSNSASTFVERMHGFCSSLEFNLSIP